MRDFPLTVMNNEGAQIPIQVHDNHQMSYGHAPYRAEDMPTPRPGANIFLTVSYQRISC